MRLRIATPADYGLVHALWTDPRNADVIDAPDDADMIETISGGNVLLWDGRGEVLGYAALGQWVPDVWGLRAFATLTRGQGKPFLGSVLQEIFITRGAHRVGLDTTVDNLPALRLFETAGFRREGVWRECWRRPSGEWVDCVFMAILRREWLA